MVVRVTLLKHEIKSNLRSLLIWSFAIGILSAGCILLYKGLEESMQKMADAYSNMGAFSAALGMDKLNVGTLEGFYATEVGLMFAIGGAMFAAMTGAVMLSKEEEGHTCEFLVTLPFGRGYIYFWKYAAVVLLVILFHIVTFLFILAGFAGVGEIPQVKELSLYHGAQLCMQLEIGSVCFCLSAISKRRQIGAALGFAMLLYMADVMCRVIPDIENLKYVTPYYFSNGADIFASGRVEGSMVAISAAVMAVSVAIGAAVYGRRDLGA